MPQKETNSKAKPAAKAKVGSFEETAKFGDIVVLAVKGIAAESAVKLSGTANLKGKTVIDAANLLLKARPSKAYCPISLHLENPHGASAEAGAEANFVKAFNSVGSPLMVNPDLKGQIPTMFICGNNAAAKTQVSRILRIRLGSRRHGDGGSRSRH